MEQVIHFLIGATAKASVLIALVFIIHLVFGRWLAPKWRHLLWGIVILRLLMPPLFESDASLFNLKKHFENAPVVESGQPVLPKVEVTTAFKAGSTEAGESGVSATAEAPLNAIGSLSPMAICFGIWLAGVLFLSTTILWTTVRIHVRLRRHPALQHPDLLSLLEACKRHLKVRTSIELIETTLVDSPALFGLFQPKILLPMGMAKTMTPDQLRYVFLHELTHLKRGDILVNWLVTIARTVHWFNPIVWLAFFRMYADREQACDETVLTTISETERKMYGHTLIDLMGTHPAPFATTGMVGIMENHTQLRKRIEMIRQFRRKSLGHALFACAIVVGVTAITLTDATAKAAEEKPKEKTTLTPITSNAAPITSETPAFDIEAKFFQPPKSVTVKGKEVRVDGNTMVVTGKPAISFPDGDQADVLSTPKATVVSGQEAMISMLEDATMEIQEKTPDGTVTVAKPKGVTLSVTPTMIGDKIHLTMVATLVDDDGERILKGKGTIDRGDSICLMEAGKKERPLLVMVTANSLASVLQAPKPTEAQLKLRRKMTSIIIPRAAFADTPISTVLEFLKSRSRSLDPDGVGVNFLLKLPKGTPEPTVSLDVENVSLLQLVKTLCEMTGLRHSIDDHAVLIGNFKPVKPVVAKAVWPLTKKLDATILSKVSFVDTPISTVLEFLNQRCKELAKDGKGVNLVLIDKRKVKKEEPTLTMDIENIPLSQLLKYICQVVNATYKVEENLIVITLK